MNRYARESDRIARARQDAHSAGREVLTPRAVQKLFKITAQAVRQAIANQRVHEVFELSLTGRDRVAMISVESAAHYWRAHAPKDLEEALERMRRRAA